MFNFTTVVFDGTSPTFYFRTLFLARYQVKRCHITYETNPPPYYFDIPTVEM